MIGSPAMIEKRGYAELLGFSSVWASLTGAWQPGLPAKTNGQFRLAAVIPG
jgi:hypothetical protein